MNKIIKLIKSAYNLSSLKLVKRIDTGYLSNNYVLTNKKDKFFLKGYRCENIKKIEEIQKIKFFLAAGGIPVILPIRNQKGSYIFTIGGVYYSLFPCVKGHILRYGNLTAKALASAGKMLARIHLLSKKKIPDFIIEEICPCNKDIFLEEIKLIKKN